MTKHKEQKGLEKQHYKAELRQLQIELVKLQRHIIRKNDKILVLLEGRDAAGKDGSIKRIIQHLSPRETRVVALGKPSDREESQCTSSAMSIICPPPQKSFSLTGAGTTVPAWKK
jgi:Uncharacterized conserved protein